VRGRCRSGGSDLTLAARPGWTLFGLLKISVGRVVWTYAIAGLFCAKVMEDSLSESSVAAGLHEQSEAPHLPHRELG
jgi:hypothetical protein